METVAVVSQFTSSPWYAAFQELRREAEALLRTDDPASEYNNRNWYEVRMWLWLHGNPRRFVGERGFTKAVRAAPWISELQAEARIRECIEAEQKYTRLA